MGSAPKTLIQAVQYFSDNRTCVEFVKNLRWSDGVVTCPRCESNHVKELSTRQIWKCYGCKKQFSVKVGTIFEQSPIGLDKWLTAMWLISNARNGVSSCEIARSIGVTQKTAWFLMHRIREAMANGTFLKLQGVVESDETYIGGSDKNKHVWERIQNIKNRANRTPKTAVMGMVERGGRVIAKVIDHADTNTLIGNVVANVDATATVYTDDLAAYNKLGKLYKKHESVNHKWEYVRGAAHTNTIEGYWSLFKRTLKGTYIHVEPFHLERYLTEQGFRYNLRKGDDFGRFETSVSQIFGARLTWRELTA